MRGALLGGMAEPGYGWAGAWAKRISLCLSIYPIYFSIIVEMFRPEDNCGRHLAGCQLELAPSRGHKPIIISNC
ncbi:hypothetical protein DFAR_1540011 [Desulfarculales bacterium]